MNDFLWLLRSRRNDWIGLKQEDHFLGVFPSIEAALSHAEEKLGVERRRWIEANDMSTWVAHVINTDSDVTLTVESVPNFLG